MLFHCSGGRCESGCQGPDCYCTQPWTTAALTELTDPATALCMPTPDCVTACDAMEECVGVLVTDHFCKLLASAEPVEPPAEPDATEQVFMKVSGLTVCTHSTEYSDQVPAAVQCGGPSARMSQSELFATCRSGYSTREVSRPAALRFSLERFSSSEQEWFVT